MSYAKSYANLQRRRFLKFIGQAGVALPVLQATGLGAGLMLSRQALAADVSQRRVIFIYVPDGTPKGASETFLPTADLGLKLCSAPLEAVKDECIFFHKPGDTSKGIDIVGGGGHGLTQRVLGAFANGVSGTLDLALEETAGATSPIASLRLGVRTRNLDPISARSYAGVTDYMDNPATAFQRLFGGSTDYSSIGSRREKQRHAMNEAALTALKSRLGSYELHKLEQHQEAINKLKQAVDNSSGDSAPAGCSNPLYNPTNVSDKQIDSEFTNLFNLQVENALMALKCNLTRIVTMQLGTHQADFGVTGLTGDYHSSVHSGNFDYYVEYRTYFSERVAHLIQRLKDEDDPAGGKLIDSTLLVQITDMGNGDSHTGDDAAFLFAGGGSVTNKGRLLPASNHHRLLDTVAQYMGVSGSIAGYDSAGPVSGVLD